jgi:hypothetical protein
MKVNPDRFRLLHSFSGKVIATANRLSDFQEVITKDQAGTHTVHDRQQGWFSSAEMVFPRLAVPGEKERSDG